MVLAPRSIAQPASWESLVEQAEKTRVRTRLSETRDLLLAARLEAGELRDDDPRRARLSFALGTVYQDLGETLKAAPLLEDARRIWEQLGVEDARYLMSLNYLASGMIERQRLAEAQQLLDRALQTGLRVLGEKHQVIAAILNILGGLYLDQGNAPKAEQSLTTAVAILRSLNSPPETLGTSLRGLAHVHWLRGDAATARRLFAESEVVTRALGEDSLTYGLAAAGLGNFLVIDGDPARAQPLLNKALHIHQSLLGPNHRDLVPILEGLSALASSEGKKTLARQHLERARDIVNKVYGSASSHHARVEEATGWLLFNDGKLAQAQALIQHSNETLRRLYGETHYTVASSFLTLALVLERQNRRDEADVAFQRSITGFEATLGENHVLVARAMKHYATFLKRSDRVKAHTLEHRAETILSGQRSR